MNSHARAVAAMLLILTASLFAQDVAGTQGVESSAALESPRDYLGYALGERYTPHARVVAWIDRLAASSDRVRVERYGRTTELRDLLLVYVTSEANQQRLEELRERMARLADPRRLMPGESPESLVEDLPVVVWLSYNVHGNETSSTEAAMKTLWELASKDDETTRNLLDQAVIIVDPCVNPDGRDRYVNWFNSVVGRRGDANPQSFEHDEPWPGGRFNHYCFDLNRDWAFMTQIETRSRIPHFVAWHPQVHVDFHEMGAESSYFFFPADRPVNQNFPHYTVKWGEIFGRGNAAAFDSRGWDYYTAESFDLFYPGYGDSWPSLHGAIGMTYEQAGHGRAGIVYRRRDETLLSLADRMNHHFTASMATIGTAVAHRSDLLLDYQRFRATAVDEGKGGPLREFILMPGDDLEHSARLVDLLRAQEVEIRRATEDFEVRDVHDYYGKAFESKRFPKGSYLISLAQPTKRLIKTLLEPKTTIKELYFYDVAAWSLPFAFGVEAYWTGEDVGAPAEPVTSAARPQGRLEEGDSTFGWLVSWQRMSGVRMAIKLLARDVKVRAATKPFTLDGKKWKRGTLFIPRGGNAADVEAILGELAQETGAHVVPARTGMTEKGIDLGSGRFLRLRRPRVALMGGPGISPTSFGATRFLLDELYGLEHSVFAIEDLGRLDLEKYTALVFPEGFFRLDDAQKKKVKEFAREGGVVIALGRSARRLTKEGGGVTAITTGGVEKKKPAPGRVLSIEEREERRRRESTPGSIFRVRLDPSHPLAFGYPKEVAAFLDGTLSFDPTAAGLPVARFADAPPLAGYIPEKKERALRGRAYASVQGQFVLFANDPNFRSFWHGLSRMFLNAVILLPRW